MDKPTLSFSPPAAEDMPIAASEIYKTFFHGPAYRVLERVRVDDDEALGLMSQGLPPDTNPADAASLFLPRWIELCFQTVGIWQSKHRGVLALPMALGSVRLERQPAEAQGKRLYALVKAVDGGAEFNAAVVDETGAVYLKLAGYRTVEFGG